MVVAYRFSCTHQVNDLLEMNADSTGVYALMVLRVMYQH